MERKIGEIFEYKGKWYQCVEDTCRNCSFYYDTVCKNINTVENTIFGNCHWSLRTDHKSVIFKKLEKVGEPYEFQKRIIQAYKLYTTPFISVNMDFIFAYLNSSSTIDIIIKQNKEDMEEKKLKPFDLEAAKAGKPVCTRDGRKARIICSDSKNDPQRPVVALVEHNDNELLYEYTIEGKERFSHISTTGTSDLMMLPEKKEGWVNVYKGGLLDTKSYPSRKEAFDKASLEDYVDTIKINWEE